MFVVNAQLEVLSCCDEGLEVRTVVEGVEVVSRVILYRKLLGARWEQELADRPVRVGYQQELLHAHPYLAQCFFKTPAESHSGARTSLMRGMQALGILAVEYIEDLNGAVAKTTSKVLVLRVKADGEHFPARLCS